MAIEKEEENGWMCNAGNANLPRFVLPRTEVDEEQEKKLTVGSIVQAKISKQVGSIMSLTLKNMCDVSTNIVPAHILPGEYLQGQITTVGRVCSVLPVGAE